MSAQSWSFLNLAQDTKLTVSFRLLLSLYLIIPICLLLQVFDSWFLQDYLKAHLPASPTHFLLFQILFGTPHIIASTVVLVTNKDYLQRYQGKLLGMTLVLALIFGIGSLFIPYRVFYILVAGWTVLHVLKQQHGVARGLCRLPAWSFHLLLGLSVAAGLCIYLGIFLHSSLEPKHIEGLKYLSSGFCICLFLSAFYCQRYVSTTLGKYFYWANIFLVLSSFYLYMQQYYFLAILAPRLVHDTTAYIFYVTHDYNKHCQKPQNFLYSLTKHLRWPIFVVLPLLSFALAFALQAYGDEMVKQLTTYFFGVEIRKVITLGVLGYLALMHYYTESFTWKQDSPYRQFISFSK